jgi:hypothetical protein
VYPSSGVVKPGQFSAGSGTTPTLMGPDHVAITDNADPMDVVVYRRGRQLDGDRLVCLQPVFAQGASDTENSLIATGTSMIVENNYGYTGPIATQGGGVTTPGLERVDLDAGGGCHRVWHSDERAPSVVAKLSLATGLVYTYTKAPNDQGVDAWYFTALDFESGRTVYRRLAGTGLGFNNNYAPVTLGSDGTAYVGALGGLVALADAVPPHGAPAPALEAVAPARPKLKLRLTRRGRHVRADLGGDDRRRVRRVDFRFAGRLLARDRRAPFRLVLPARYAKARERRRLRAVVLLRDGRRVTLRVSGKSASRR